MILVTIISLLCAASILAFTLAFTLPTIEGLRARRNRGRQRLIQGGNVEVRAAGPQLRRVEAPGFLADFLSRFRGEEDAIDVSGQALSGPRLMLIVLGGCLIGFILHAVTGLPLFLSIPATLFAAALVMAMLARMKANRRRAAIADSMPEALDTMVRTLRVGLPVSTALRHVAEKLPGPLSEELRATTERIAFGQDITEALYALANRTRNTDLHFFAASVSIQLVTGGNLADVLDRLAGIARSRQQLRRKVDSITAEARWSGRFLSVFPVLAIMAVSLMNPKFFDPLLESAALIPIAIGVSTLLVVNVVFMRWLSKLE